jgi:PAS domain S-box-containing protein
VSGVRWPSLSHHQPGNPPTRGTIPVIETLALGTIQGLANHTVLIARDGSERAIADSCAPIRDRDGRVVGAVLVFRDVTDEYAAQQALRDSAALIETILNTVVDGIITLQAHGGIVETVNPAAEQMFGYSAAELIGSQFQPADTRACPGSAAGVARALRWRAPKRAPSVSGREVVGRRKDGSLFPLEIAASEMWLGGSVTSPASCAISPRASRPKRPCSRPGPCRARFQQRQFLEHRHRRPRRHPDLQRRRRTHAGLRRRRRDEQITPADISDPQK